MKRKLDLDEPRDAATGSNSVAVGTGVEEGAVGGAGGPSTGMWPPLSPSHTTLPAIHACLPPAGRSERPRVSRFSSAPPEVPVAADAPAGGPPRVNPLNGRPYSRRYGEIYEGRKKLPVWGYLDSVQDLLEKNQVIVIEGETGSGKTTQIPQFLVHAGFGRATGNKMVCCTQPRRVAAMSIAQRVADEMDVALGEEVGYTIRFEDKSNKSTVLKCASPSCVLCCVVCVMRLFMWRGYDAPPVLVGQRHAQSIFFWCDLLSRFVVVVVM